MSNPKSKRKGPRRRIRRARPLLVAAVGALLLAGCSDTPCQGICTDSSAIIPGDMGIPARHE